MLKTIVTIALYEYVSFERIPGSDYHRHYY